MPRWNVPCSLAAVGILVGALPWLGRAAANEPTNRDPSPQAAQAAKQAVPQLPPPLALEQRRIAAHLDCISTAVAAKRTQVAEDCYVSLGSVSGRRDEARTRLAPLIPVILRQRIEAARRQLESGNCQGLAEQLERIQLLDPDHAEAHALRRKDCVPYHAPISEQSDAGRAHSDGIRIGSPYAPRLGSALRLDGITCSVETAREWIRAQVLRQHLSQHVGFCVERSLAQLASPRTEISARFTLAPTGEVLLPPVIESQGLPRDVSSCVADAIDRKRFLMPPDEPILDVRVTWSYVRSTAGAH